MKNPIDLASTWLSKREASYLAKENVIVYFASTTGRKSDYQWITLSVAEVVRIIQATLMNSDNSHTLQAKHIIAACQELDRVFEFGVKSNHVTRPEVFNYLRESGMNMLDSIVFVVADLLYANGKRAFLISDVEAVINEVCSELDVEYAEPECRDYIDHHFSSLGYNIRTGANRPEFEGKKQRAIMWPNERPKDIEIMSGEYIKHMRRSVSINLK